ncbi:MAG: hypothetical protein NTW50_02775 [Candidatus Berkelbacteria bacterium]|nr:hypothetical protein [Candidatus Berkelbacteria bacterium]
MGWLRAVLVLDPKGNLLHTLYGPGYTGGYYQKSFLDSSTYPMTSGGPDGIGVDGAGNVYISESVYSHQIYVYNSSGVFQRQFTSPFSTYGPIFVDASGNIYGKVSSQVRKVSSTGVYISDIPNCTGAYFTIDSTGRCITVTSGYGPTVSVVSSTGTVISSFSISNSGDTGVYYPQGIGVDAAGRIYVDDQTRGYIKILDPKTRYQLGKISILTNPGYFGVSPDGRVSVVQLNGSTYQISQVRANYLLSDNLTVSDSFGIGANGSLDVASNSVSVGGNWNNQGNFVSNAGTVNLNGGSGTTQVVSGNTTFNNFSITGNMPRTVNFAPGSNQTISGTFTASGVANNLLSLGRDGTSGVWNITPSSTVAKRVISFVSVSNANNNTLPIINPTNSQEGIVGSTTNWFSFTLTPILHPFGVISPNIATTVPSNANQTFSFTPFAGHSVKSVKIDGTALTGTLPTSYTFTNVTGPHSIEVEFSDYPLCTWSGLGGNNNWSTAANWLPANVPDSTCGVVFDGTSTKSSTLDAGFTNHIKSLSVNSGFSGSTAILTIGKALLNDGDFSQNDGVVNLSADFSANGNFSLNAGTFSAGNYTVNIGGALNMAATPTATFNKGTSTINLNSLLSGSKNINTNGQELYRINLNSQPSTAATPVVIVNGATTSVNKISRVDGVTYAAGGLFIPTSGRINARAMAADPDGNFWILETPSSYDGYTQYITKISAKDSSVITSFSVASGYGNIVKVLVDSSGNIWSLGMSGGKKFSSTGNAIFGFSASIDNTSSFAFDGLGNLWITNGVNITKVSSTGTVVGTYVSDTTYHTGTGGVAADSYGNIWVANPGSGGYGVGLVKMDNNGNILKTIDLGNTILGPIAIDKNNNIWVTQYSGSITRIDLSGNILGLFTPVSSASSITGITSDISGNLWVSSSVGSVGYYSACRLTGSLLSCVSNILTGSQSTYGIVAGFSTASTYWTDPYASSSSLSIANGLAINNNTTLNASGYDLTIGDSGNQGEFAENTGGTFTAPAAGKNFSVNGNWTYNGGVFNHNSGTVNLNGGGGSTQTVTGDTTFYNLTSMATAARNINFAANSTQTISGRWSVIGSPSQRITLGLKSGDSGVWKVSPTLWSGTMNWVSVSNSTNQASANIDPINSVDGGNNVKWFTQLSIQASADVNSTISPSGTVAVSYGNDKTFTLSANSGYDLKAVYIDGIALSGTLPATYTFANVIDSTHTITIMTMQHQCVFIGGGANNGSGAYTWTDPANWIGNIIPNQNCVVVFDSRANNRSSAIWTKFTIAGFLMDTGYTGSFSMANSSSAELVVTGDFTVNSGTYAPQTWTTTHVGGSLYFAPAPTAIFNSWWSTFIFDGNSPGKTIDFSNQTPFSVKVDGVGGSWALQNDLTLEGSLWVNNGLLIAGSKNISLAEILSVPNTANFSSSGNITLRGGAHQWSQVDCGGTLSGTVGFGSTGYNDTAILAGCTISMGSNPTAGSGFRSLTNYGTVNTYGASWVIPGGSVINKDTGTINANSTAWVISGGSFTNYGAVNANGTSWRILAGSLINYGNVVVDGGSWTTEGDAYMNGGDIINHGTINHKGNYWSVNGNFVNDGNISYSGTTFIKYGGTYQNIFTQLGTFDTAGKTILFNGINQGTTITCADDAAGELGKIRGIVKFGSFSMSPTVQKNCSISLGANPYDPSYDPIHYTGGDATVWTFGTLTNYGTVTVDGGNWTSKGDVYGNGGAITNHGTINHNGDAWSVSGNFVNDGNVAYKGTIFNKAGGTSGPLFTQIGNFNLDGKMVWFTGGNQSAQITCNKVVGENTKLGGIVKLDMNPGPWSRNSFVLNSGCEINMGDNAVSSLWGGYGQIFVNNGVIDVGVGSWRINLDGLVDNFGTINNQGSTWTMTSNFTNEPKAVVNYPNGMVFEMAGTTGAGAFVQNGSFSLDGKIVLFDGINQGARLTCNGELGGTVKIDMSDLAHPYNSFTLNSGCHINLGDDPVSTVQGGYAGSFLNNGIIDIKSGKWTVNLSINHDSINFINNGTINHFGNNWAVTTNFVNNSGAVINFKGNLSVSQSFLQNGTFDTSGVDLAMIHSGNSTYHNTEVLHSFTTNLDNGAYAITLDSNMTTGDFSALVGGISNPGTAKVLTITGNYIQNQTGNLGGGNLTTIFTGSNNQTVTQGVTPYYGQSMMGGPIRIDKPAGTVTLNSTFQTNNVVELAQGTFDLSKYNFTVAGAFSVDTGTALQLVGTQSSISIPALADNTLVRYTGITSTQTANLQNWSYYNLETTGSIAGNGLANYSLNSDVTVRNNFTTTGGFNVGTKTINVAGNVLIQNGANWNSSATGKLNLTASNPGFLLTTGGATLGNLGFNSPNGNGAWLLQDDLKVAGTLTVDNSNPMAGVDLSNHNIDLNNVVLNGGTLSGDAALITVSGNWSNTATASVFDPGVSIVTLDNTTGNQKILGNNTFYDLYFGATADRSISFSANKLTTILNTWSILPNPDIVISLLRDGGSGNDQWLVKSVGARNIENVFVQNSHSDDSVPVIDVSRVYAVNGGNTYRWRFSDIMTVSGTCKTIDLSANCDAGEVIKVESDGQVGWNTGKVLADGTFIVTKLPAPPAGYTVTIFVDGVGEAKRANGATKYNSGNIAKVALAEKHLSLGSSQNTELSNAELASYDKTNSANDNIIFDVNFGNVAGDLNVGLTAANENYTLDVLSGNTYSPCSSSGCMVQVGSVKNVGTINGGAADINIKRDWLNSGTFSGNVSTVDLIGTDQNRSIQTGSNGSAFNQLIAGNSGSWNLADDLTASGFLNIANGTINANNHNLNVGNFNQSGGVLQLGTGLNFTTNGTFSHSGGNLAVNSATLTFSGAGSNKAILFGDAALAKVVFDGVGSWKLTDATTLSSDFVVKNSNTTDNGVDLNGQALTIAGNLSLTSGKLTPGNSTISLAGDWQNSAGKSNFASDSGTSTVIFTRPSGTQTISGATKFKKLQMPAPSAGRTIKFASDASVDIATSWDANGSSAGLLNLSGTNWNVNPSTDSKVNVNYVGVDNSNNIGQKFCAARSKDNGGNTAWYISATDSCVPDALSSISLSNPTTDGFKASWALKAPDGLTAPENLEDNFLVYLTDSANTDTDCASSDNQKKYPSSPSITTNRGVMTSNISNKAVNVRYCAKVVAKNIFGSTAPAYSNSLATLIYELKSPSLPSDKATENSLGLIINQSGNPDYTEFAVHISGGSINGFVQPDGTIGPDKSWREYVSGWGGNNGIIIGGLQPRVTYTFYVVGRNLDHLEGKPSPIASRTTTLENLSVDFSADPMFVTYNGSTTLHLSSNGTSCTASSNPLQSGWNGSVPVNTSVTIYNIKEAISFSVTCTKSGVDPVTQSIVVSPNGGSCVFNGGNKIEASMLCVNNFYSVGNNSDFTGSFVAKNFNIPSSSVNTHFFYDYNLDNGWPPGFRALVLPNSSETGNQ